MSSQFGFIQMGVEFFATMLSEPGFSGFTDFQDYEFEVGRTIHKLA